MRGPSWIIIGTTVILEMIAFGLAIGAMTRRSKASIDTNLVVAVCSYSSDIATGLAAGAILFLIAGQAILMIVTGCLCCGSGTGRGKGRACAIVSFVITWFTFVIAEIFLIAGASLNKHHSNNFTYLDAQNLTCKEVRKSVFAAGAAFTFLTLVFGEIYYLTFVKSTEDTLDSYKSGNPTINMTAYP